MTLREITPTLEKGTPLEPTQIEIAAQALLSENVSVDEKIDFLRILHEKGEKPSEIAGFVRAFLQHARHPEISTDSSSAPLIDLCGTGGDKLHLFNISTATCFVLAAAGAHVVKHGNRGITSRSGGADILEALGIPIDLEPTALAQSVTAHGFGFLFAPLYHPAFKAVIPVRQKLAAEGQRTIFNLLGPLLNPVQPPFQLLGVYDPTLLHPFAEILQLLGRQRAWVVHGEVPGQAGMDECSTLGPTRVVAVDNREIKDFTLKATDYDLPQGILENLRGGTPEENALLMGKLLDGTAHPDLENIVVWNSAAALVVAGLAEDLKAGIDLAREQIRSGRAREVLEALR